MRKPDKVGRLSGPEVQKYAQAMTNWQRSQWAKSGYRTEETWLKHFLETPRQ